MITRKPARAAARLKLTSSVRAMTWLVGAAMASSALAAPALAQEGNEEEIVITGTRIPRPDYEFSNPVVSVGADAIEYSGATNLTDFVSDVPALVGSFDSEKSADTSIGGLTGINLLNLRNLGEERTLTLVNGRRHVASQSGTQAVDVNTIPIGLIDRVEVLTGGASAVYGADGVTGVVNFILKDDYEGLEGRFQIGGAEQGGGGNTFASIIGGRNFAQGRGNIAFSFEYSGDSPVLRDQRDFTRLGNRRIFVNNPDDPLDDPNLPDLVPLNNIRYIDTAPGGGVITDLDFGDSLSGEDFQGDGSPWVDGVDTGNFTMQGGSGSPLDLFTDELLPALDRWTFNLMGHYDLNANWRIEAEAKWAHIESTFEAQPTFDFGLFVPMDNAYMPASIRDDASLPGNIADAIGGVLVFRDNLDLGDTYHDVTRDTYRTVLALNGKIAEGLNFDLSYVWGQTDTDDRYRNRNNERFFAAIDAVDDGSGNIVCRSSISGPGYIPDNADPASFGSTFTPGPGDGCVPANIFGPNISQAARDWISVDTLRTNTIRQQVVTAYFSGDSHALFQLPGGPIGYALGGEWRREESEDFADPLEKLGASLGSDIVWAGQNLDTLGSFEVREAFAELNVPIVRDLPLFKEFSVDLAYRLSDYSTSGQTETWRYGGLWRVSDAFLLRATHARAVRAPNIFELFTPPLQTFELITDPCDGDEVDFGTSQRLANCTTELGFDPHTFDNTTSDAVEGVLSGNKDLQPEEADTITWGFVLQPPFIRGLTFSVDYYDISLEQAIQRYDAQTIVDKCYDLPQPNDFCGLLSRDPTTHFVDGFVQRYLNVSSYTTSGYDFTIRYDFSPEDWGWGDWGDFAVQLIGNKLDDLTFVEVPGAEPDSDVSDPDAPEWQAVLDVTWRRGNWLVNYGYSWYDKTRRFEDREFVVEPDRASPQYHFYEDRSVHDIYVRHDWGDRFSVYGGINNITNQEPEPDDYNVPVSPLGRFFFVGARARFH